MKKSGAIFTTAICCLGAMGVTAAVTVASNESAAPAPTKPTTAFDRFAVLGGAGEVTDEEAVDRIVSLADSGKGANGVPLGSDLETSKAVSTTSIAGAHLTLVPGRDGESLCWATKLPVELGNVSDGSCVAYLPETGVLLGGSNDSRVDGFVVYGLAADDAGSLTITTRDGNRKAVPIKDNFFLWASDDRNGDAPVMIEASNKRGEVLYKQDLASLTAQVKPPREG